jgi:hypothetical protein
MVAVSTHLKRGRQFDDLHSQKAQFRPQLTLLTAPGAYLMMPRAKLTWLRSTGGRDTLGKDIL